MIEMPTPASPAWIATITSGTVDMPTTSAPMARSIRYSARVSRFGPGHRDVHAFAQHDPQLERDRAGQRAQLGIVRRRHVGKPGPSRSSLGPTSGLSPSRLM